MKLCLFGKEAFHLPPLADAPRAVPRRYIRQRQTYEFFHSPIAITEVCQRLIQIGHSSLTVI